MTNKTTRREANRLRTEILEGMAERQERTVTARKIRRCGTIAHDLPRWSVPRSLARMLPWNLLSLVPDGALTCLN